jgi:hypothetical protein
MLEEVVQPVAEVATVVVMEGVEAVRNVAA